ncbi:hypothetical protein [Pseudomonas putida]|nr:hypothetical protein [Pseudomonas putida]MDF3929844.1 hypothetical protein [Pseudomonas putida]
MPTENRSSNTEMVSVPRGLIEQLEQFGEGSTPGRTVRKDALEQLYACCTQPAPQPHPEPIAWMVGTAFWWTKEEAERDAAATGKPMTPFGPMTGTYTPAEQHQGEPVAVLYANGIVLTKADCGDVFDICCKVETPLYTHVDPGEAGKWRNEAHRFNLEVERLRAQLAECEAMAAMVAEREWAEHAGTGDVSSKVETAFAQLHNDLHEAGEKLAERDALLRDVRGAMREYEQGCDQFPPFHHNQLMERIDAALPASAEQEARS